jgi:hypothetical protein
MRTIILATAALLLAGAPAASATPPDNDDYLAATAFNAPGEEMPRDAIVWPATDTSEAALQAELFPGGPPEPIACGSTPLDHSVWYRFVPDVAGRISLEAVGYDSTVALVPFSAPGSPFPEGYDCANRRDDNIETLERAVDAGMSYAVQVAGAQGASGTLQVRSTFLPDRDGDGVSDEQDSCPTRPGTANGCPPRIGSGIEYSYDSAPRGGVFLYLIVRGAPRGARVDVRCSRGCRHQRLTVRSNVTRVTSFRGRFIPAGAKVEVRVTKAGHIGDYRAFTVAGGKVTRTDGCLPPGSTKPRRTCK